MEEHDNIQLRSDEVEDILGRPPSWIISWGTTVIFITLGMVLAISWIVEYPDIIDATIEITTPSPPMTVVAEESGRLLQLNVKADDDVKKGTLVAVIESAANFEDMLWLEKKVDKMRDSKVPFSFSKKLQLGDVQFAYSNFQRDYKDYSFKVRGTFSKQQVEQISKMIKGVENKMSIAEDKKINFRNQLQFLQDKLNRYEGMLRQGAISQQEVENVRAEYNALSSTREDIRSEIAGYEGEIDRLNAQKLEIQRGKIEGGNDKWIQAQESLNKLAGEIDAWKKRFMITAPVDGKVTLFDVRTEQQYVESGKEIMMIVPQQEEIIGRVELPVQGAGKVQKNQDVNILLHEYPSKEYGVVQGKIKSISLIPKDNKYFVEVSLPNGLLTTYKDTLVFKQQMSGVAEIKTDERRFLLRIFDKFADLFRNK